MDIAQLNEKIKQESAFVDLLFAEIGKVIVGQKEMVERLVVGLLGNGHILLEGVPGLAKTLAIKTLSSSMKAKSFPKGPSRNLSIRRMRKGSQRKTQVSKTSSSHF